MRKIIEEGREIFIGAKNPDVNCASCHGKDGKPVKAGARDFRVERSDEAVFRLGLVLAHFRRGAQHEDEGLEEQACLMKIVGSWWRSSGHFGLGGQGMG